MPLKITAKTATNMQTIVEEPINSSRLGQLTFKSSVFTSTKNETNLFIAYISTTWGKVAGQEGFEPPTRGFGVRRSTN
jgi:hypothetical protein